MSTITSGVGIFSGLPIAQIVDSLIAAQSGSLNQLKSRVSDIGNRRTALLQISAQILAVRNSAARFTDADFFHTAKAASSDETTLLASVGSTAAVGQYSLTVRNLASAQQVISDGFATSNATPIGAGTLTIETAAARLNRSTPLGQLRGGSGVQRGRIQITDRTGGAAEIDLTASATIDAVVAAINNQTKARVTARVEGDHLVLADQTGATAGSLSVAEVGGGKTAAQLGILGSGAETLTGTSLVFVVGDTRLDDLNDGNGVRHLKGQGDFSVSLADGTAINVDVSGRLKSDTPLSLLNGGTGATAGSIRLTNRAGAQFVVNLSSAATIGDVQNAIQAASPDFTLALSGGELILNDRSTGSKQTVVEDIGSGTTAASLGLVGSSTTGAVTGRKIYSLDTVGDVVRLVNGLTGNGGRLVASIAPDGAGLRLADTTSGSGAFAVTAQNGSAAAEDLGLLGPASGGMIQSSRLLAGLDTVLLRSLNGGSGVRLGTIQVTNRAGASATIDLSGAHTLAEVISAINAAAPSVTAAVSSNGLGIALTDASGGGGNLIVSDVNGSTAADLHLAGTHAADSVSSGNLQQQYVSAATRLTAFNNGAGVPPGKFRITDSSGRSAVVDLTQGNEERLQDVIDEINSRGIGVTARINSGGDGLVLEDTAGGGGRLTVADVGGVTAKALRILGKADEGSTLIDGTLETRIHLTGNDTLEDLTAKLRAAGAPVAAAILNDGGSSRPFRLSLTSATTGLAGSLAIDPGATNLRFDTLVEGRDATVLFGPPGSPNPIVLTNKTNTLTDVIPGVRLDLVGVSDRPATVTVTQDTDSIAQSLSTFVTTFNNVISGIDQAMRFDPESGDRSVLTGDDTARRIRERLIDLTGAVLAGSPSRIDRLSRVGITLSKGTTLQFDAAKFREAYASDPRAVEDLFTTKDKGLGTVIQKTLDGLAGNNDGVIATEDTSLKDSQDLLNKRISELQTLLDRQRQRLTDQFNAMESAIAQLQTQQKALSVLGTSTLATPKF